MAIRSRNYIKTNINNFSIDTLAEDDEKEARCDNNVFHAAYYRDDDNSDKINDQNIYLQRQASHTSGSLDCSSAGSIPWAEDAIKLNHLEWEKIEHMLSGRLKFSEAGKAGDIDEALRKEILDWQHKFPELLTANGKRKVLPPTNQQQLFSNFSDSEDFSNNSNSDNDFDDNNVDQLLKCQEYQINSNNRKEENFHKAFTKFSIRENEADLEVQEQRQENTTTEELAELFNGFTLTSIRCKLNRREQLKNSLPKLHNKNNKNNSSNGNSNSNSNNNNNINYNNQNNGITKYQPIRCQAKQQQQQISTNLSANYHSKRLRMPPIGNVLDNTRKFQKLGPMKQNQSFVQLTKIPQQAKSAVIRHNNVNDYNLNDNDDNVILLTQRNLHKNKHSSAWLGHVERIRNHCYLNNRNAIILPAIPTRPTIMHQYTNRNRNNSSTNRNGQMLMASNNHSIINNSYNLWPQETFTMNVKSESNRRRNFQTVPHSRHEFGVAIRIGVEYNDGRRLGDQRVASSVTNSSSTSGGRSISALPIATSYNAAAFSPFNASANIAHKYNVFK